MLRSFFMPGQMALFFYLILLSAVANAAPGFGAEKHTISLHEAITRTIEQNPDLRAFDYQRKAQQGRVLQAGLAPSPELSFELEDVLGSGDNRGVDSAEATLSISWVIERGVRQRYIATADAGSSLLSAEADARQLDAAAETAHRYLASLAWQAREVNADKAVLIAEETIQSVAKRVTAGKTPKAELSRAQAELARRKLEREEINHELASTNRRLAAQWGVSVPAFSRVEGSITGRLQVTSFETLKSRLQQNPEFALLSSERQLRRAELQLTLAKERPNWRLNAGVRHSNSSNDQAFVAGITIPFGERTRNPGRIAAARANLAKIDQQESAVRTRIETALYVIYEKLQHSLHIINTLRGEIIPPLEQALTETFRAYNLGRYSYLEWRTVQAEVLDAHNALIEASIEAHHSMIEIERLTGVRLAEATTAGNSL